MANKTIQEDATHHASYDEIRCSFDNRHRDIRSLVFDFFCHMWPLEIPVKHFSDFIHAQC